jgi:tetratricopeptide (TPR) repeat protein
MPLLLALLAAQVGPLVTPGAAPPLPHEREVERPRRRAVLPEPKFAQAPAPSRRQLCIRLAETTPAEGEASAASWLAQAQGADRAFAGECLGIALMRQAKWDAAERAFLAARDAAEDKPLRARLGAMAGNAALAHGSAAAALFALDSAKADASADPALTGGIAVDRARALVMLKRNAEAATALAEARAATPGDADAWLLSATLSRRMNKLAEAQAQIEKAAALSPADPDVGLEAGLIAVLAGQEEAARRSWQSVLSTAPDSDAAATAKGYLAQLSPQGTKKP